MIHILTAENNNTESNRGIIMESEVIEKILEANRGCAKYIIEELNQDYIPILQIARGEKVLAMGSLNDLDKDQWYDAILQAVQVLDADGYIFMGEAYAVQFHGVQKIRPMSEIPIDDREDTLMLLYVGKDGTIIQESTKITTVPGRRILGEWKRITNKEAQFQYAVIVSW